MVTSQLASRPFEILCIAISLYLCDRSSSSSESSSTHSDIKNTDNSASFIVTLFPPTETPVVLASFLTGNSTLSFQRHSFSATHRPARGAKLELICDWAILSMFRSSRRSSTGFARSKPLFDWYIENEDHEDLPTCVPFKIGVNPRLNGAALVFPYRLTVFAAGKKAEDVLVEPDADGQITFMVKEPVGTEFTLRLRDANGIEGGFLPSVFNAVAGSSTSCINTTSTEPEYSSKSDVAGKWKPPDSLKLDVVGGVPPYDLTVALLGPSSSSILKTRLTQCQSVQPAKNAGTRALLAAVSDSTGEWVSGTSLIHFQDSKFKWESNPNVPICVHNSLNFAVLSEKPIHLHTPATYSSKSQHIFWKRDTSDEGGSIIMIVDAVILALLLGSALAVAILEIIRRRRKKKQAKHLHMQTLDVEASQRGTPSTNNLDENETTQEPTTRESLDKRHSSSSDDVKVPITSAPPFPVTPTDVSPSTTISTSALPRFTAVPESYGDPYPSSTRDMYGSGFPLHDSRPSSSSRSPTSSYPTSLSRASSYLRSSTSRRPSFSSFFSAKAARSIGRYTRFSETFYPDEPAISDARSAVLAREPSQLSSRTINGKRENSRVRRQPATPPHRGESDITEGEWHENSGVVPAVPPLVFRHGDVQW